MPLESSTYINGLVSTNPVVADGVNQGDDHIRLIKSVLKNTFPNLTAAMTATAAALNLITTAPGGCNVTPANPTGVSGGTRLMMGLGSSATITPARSGKVLFTISGTIQNATPGDGFNYTLQYGTGAAPANQGALVGTQGSGAVTDVPNATGHAVPFSTQAYVTGLVVGTPVWFDIALANFLGGTAAISNLTCTAVEL